MAERQAQPSTDQIMRFVAIRDAQRIPDVTLPRVDVVFPPAANDAEVAGAAVRPAVIRVLDDLLTAGGEVTYDDITTALLDAWQAAHPDPPDDDRDRRRTPRPRDLAWLVAQPDFQTEERGSAGRFAAVLTSTDPPAAERPVLMRTMQLYALIHWLAGRATVPADRIRPAADSAVVYLAGLTAEQLPTHGKTPAEEPENPEDPGDNSDAPALPATAAAYELINAAAEVAELLRVPVARPVPDPDDPDTFELPSWRMTPRRRAALSGGARATLTAQNLDHWTSIVDIVETLRVRAAELYADATRPTPEQRRAWAQEAAVERASRRLGITHWPEPAKPVVGPILVRPPRIGDLEVVEQTFKHYEKGEIAHVENVMAHETRERRHRVVDLAESEEIRVDEREEETTTENATTTRSELSSEVGRVTSDDTQVTAGATVNAKYGPYVEVSANVGYSSSTATERSEKQAQSYAEEVTDRAAARIRRRVVTTQRRLTRREVTEQNLHRFANTTAQHTVGIYRWLNKVYSMQLVNLGQRLLLELVVPDPAANYRYAAATGGVPASGMTPPPPFTHPDSGAELGPDDVTPLTYKALAGRFRARVSPPPPEFRTVMTTLRGEKTPELRTGAKTKPEAAFAVPAQSAASEQLQVPAGYQPAMWLATVVAQSYLYAEMNAVEGNPDVVKVSHATYRLTGDRAGTLAVGPSLSPFGTDVTELGGYFAYGTWGVHQPGGLPPMSAAGDADMALPVVLSCLGPVTVNVNVVVIARRVAETLDAWRLSAFEALRLAHAQWDADYRADAEGDEIGRGVVIEGRNPGENAQTIRTELKRSAIRLLGGPDPDGMTVVDPGDPGTQREPSVHLGAAAAVGPEIAFWEQTFEWENLTQVFYPYFWTGRADWPQQSRLNDPDPVFAEFLRAGAAKVVVPVRPGFEAPACLRLAIQLPRPWTGDPAPVLKRPPWTDLAEELRLRQIRPQAKKVGAPWPLVLPTTLVMLDDGADLFDRETPREPE